MLLEKLNEFIVGIILMIFTSFVVKVCEKRHIIREKKVEYVKREKEVLNLLSESNSFFVRLYCTFQDKERLYFVLSYAKNGEMLQYINRVGSFDLECAKFYTGELILALEVLHSKGIIHRDLKPENILLDENMHILITDFGSAKIVLSEEANEDSGEVDERTSERRRKNSFVGTAQYVSPELLTDSAATNASDLWALGCILYQMISGLPPFRAGSEYLIFQKILKLDYEFPEGFSEDAKDLVEKLLVIDAQQRLGMSDVVPYKSIREHKFFADLDFKNLGSPPRIRGCVPNVGVSGERYNIGDQEPGLNDEKVSRLQLESFCASTVQVRQGIADLEPSEIARRLQIQKQDKWHALVDGNLILKQGLVDKRKGLFARRRMLLLTLGPHLYYVDPNTMVLKGEIPWTVDLKVEPKNFKTFFVHTVSINI